MVTANPLEPQLRPLAPLDGSDSGPGDAVALEALSDRTGLSAGVLGRCFVLQSARCEVHVLSPEGRTPLRLLCSPAPLFPLSGIALSPDGVQLVLFGAQGACCVSVAALDSSGPASTASRRPAMLLDLSGRSQVSVSRVQWLSKTSVLLLLSDNTAHRFHSCLAAVDPSRVVTRPPSAVLKLRPPPTRQEAALREFAVDAAAVAESPELLFLLGSGEVLWSAGDGVVVREPLRWTPAAVDNYGCDFCTLLCLNAGPLRVLVVGTTAGQLFHCLLLRSKAATPPQLAVFDAVDLALPSTAHQLRLVPDRLQPHRYFALHAGGLHVVHLPWLPQLASLYQQQKDPLPERISALPASLVEHALCLQPLPSSRPNAPAALLQVGPPAATRLLCVLRNGDVVACTVRCPLPPERKEDAAAVNSDAPSTASAEPKSAAEGELVLQLKRLFTAETFQPLLHGGTTAPEGREMMEFLQRVAAVLARQFMQPLDAARALLSRRLDVLSARRAAQAAQLEAAEAEQQEAAAAAKRLLERLAEAEARGERLRALLGRASERLGALLPRRASRAEERAAGEARRLQERTAALQAWVERTSEKHEFCAKLQGEAHRRPAGGAKGPGMQAAVSKQLCAVLQDEGQRIGELIARLRGLQGQVTTA